MTIRATLLTSAVTSALAGSAFAEGCDKIIFSDVGWTDITATTAATALVAEALGYETAIKVRSVPVTYTGLAEGIVEIDDRRTKIGHLEQAGLGSGIGFHRAVVIEVIAGQVGEYRDLEAGTVSPPLLQADR